MTTMILCNERKRAIADVPFENLTFTYEPFLVNWMLTNSTTILTMESVVNGLNIKLAFATESKGFVNWAWLKGRVVQGKPFPEGSKIKSRTINTGCLTNWHVHMLPYTFTIAVLIVERFNSNHLNLSHNTIYIVLYLETGKKCVDNSNSYYLYSSRSLSTFIRSSSFAWIIHQLRKVFPQSNLELSLEGLVNPFEDLFAFQDSSRVTVACLYIK